MEFSLDMTGIDKVQVMLDPKAFDRAASRALNRAVRSGLKAGRRQITKIYEIKPGGVNRSIKVKNARINNLEATVTVKGEPIPFKYFGARQTQEGVTIKIKKTEGRKLIPHAWIGGYVRVLKPQYRGLTRKELSEVPKSKRYTMEVRAHMLSKKGKQMKWGGGNVFIRKYKHKSIFHPLRRKNTNYVVTKLMALSIEISELFQRDKVWEAFATRLNRSFIVNFRHEYDRELSK